LAPWNVNDQKIPQGRLALFSYVSAALVVLLLVGFWKLQVVESEHYADIAEKNGIRPIAIIAPRGAMLDRDGRVLVDSYPSFSILLMRDNPKLLEKSLPQIEDGLGISKEDLQQQLEAAKFEPKFLPLVLKPAATEADIEFVESHRADLPVLELEMVQRRRYPLGETLANTIGYVGEISPDELAKNPDKYKPGDIVGKAGLEREYNDQIVGTDGMKRVVVNSVGKVIRTLDNIDAIPGKPIQLTIDEDLQRIAETDMADKQGAVVAMDGHTGEILAMISRPTFDPNDFAVRIPPQEWAALNRDPNTPLLNRAIQAQLAPGSTFKIIMATAMLESKAIPADFTAYCPGEAVFYGRVFHCWQAKGHGTVDVHSGIVHSCDVFFYNLGQRLGIDTIDKYATGLGLGRRTGIDLPGEEPGLMPSEEWVQRVYHHKWYAGETISVAIGQGAVIVTPIQMVRAYDAVANGGTLVQPHLLKNLADPKVEHFPLSDDTVEQVTQGMYDVINEGGGTGYALRLQNVDFSGKSGTAQVMSYEAGAKVGGRAGKLTNGWFVGYAPRRNPDIVVAAVVQGSTEHGGTTAGPVVRDLVKAFYDKKAGRLTPPSTADNIRPGGVTPVSDPEADAEAEQR